MHAGKCPGRDACLDMSRQRCMLGNVPGCDLCGQIGIVAFMLILDRKILYHKTLKAEMFRSWKC